MEAVVDFHSHILPGIDDGSASVEESLAMLRLEARQGITRVVATPHFYPRRDTPERFLERRARAEAELRAQMANEPGLPEIIPAAEVYFFRGMSESEELRGLAVGESAYLLLEMPQPPWPEEIWRELEAIPAKRGLTPIIAHIDRYIGPFRTYQIPQRLAKMPVLVQANAGFFLDKGTAGMAMRMIKADQIQLLGSDCHDLTSRKPNLGGAVERIRRKLGEGPLDRVRQFERQILGAETRPYERME